MSIKLGPLVGATSHNVAKIWVQTHKPSALECRVFTNAQATRQIHKSPFAFKTEAANGNTGVAIVTLPQSGNTYYYRIHKRSAGKSVPVSAILSFRTFPAPNRKIESVSFGLVSCHKPKKFKDETVLRSMWRHLFLEMSRRDAAFLLLVGDQVYADHKKSNAWKKSLKETSRRTRLDIYREVYLKHWDFPEMQMVLGNFPSFMTWDDHEIVNGWGSSKKHNNKIAQNVFATASKVYEEFQHNHNPETLAYPRSHKPKRDHKPYYYAFRYGPVAILVLDLRGNRKVWLKQLPLLGADQWQAVRHWFASKDAKDSKILFLVTSVPVVHLRMTLARIFWWLKTDIADQWSVPHNKQERNELLRLLFDQYIQNGKRKVFILSGDVHVGTFAQIKDRTSRQNIYQFTSSPISNKPSKLLDRLLARFSSKFTFNIGSGKERPVDVEISKRYRQRNFGIVSVIFDPLPKTTIRMYQEKESEPNLPFSDSLPP